MGIETIVEEKRRYYKRIGSIFCPIINETVYFTSEGFNHLLYKSYWKTRNISERYMKLKNLKHVPSVIRNCSKNPKIRKIDRKIKGKWKEALNFELIHEVVPGAKVRVIIEKVGNGHYTFRSVMPHDNKSKRILATKKRS